MLGSDVNFLIGYSGHGLVVAEAAILSGCLLSGYFDLKEVRNNPFELKYMGNERMIDFEKFEERASFLLGIGDNNQRLKVATFLSKMGFKLATIIHPNSSISELSRIDKGVFIARGVCINPLATIGENAIINTAAVIDHECIIEANAHVGPGVVLAGNVRVESGAFVGANSVVRQGLSVGANSIVGAGSVVVKSVPANQLWVGNPAAHLNRF